MTISKFAIQKGNPGAAYNTDRDAFIANMARRKAASELNNKIDEINTIKDQISAMQQEQAEIKDLLNKLLEKIK